MRVVIAPDSFTGSMTARQAAAAIDEGWRRTAPGDQTVLLPISDGGPGFVTCLAAGLGGALVPVSSQGPWGAAAEGQILIVAETGGRTAYLEVAQVAGGQVGAGDALAGSSAGVADLLLAAIDAGATRVVVGLGGTVTSDGGAGMLAALGATALDAQGGDATDALLAGGGSLGAVASVDLSAARAKLASVELLIATDVDNPLLGPRGSARGFAPQKGVGEADIETLEEALRALAHACGRTGDGRSPAVALGAGAAGGIGFALLHLGAERVSGIDWVLGALDFGRAVAGSDLVITGEGAFDWQSMHGKGITGVSRSAMEYGRPVLLLAGRIEVGRREWMALGISGAYAISDQAGQPTPGEPALLEQGPALLADLAGRAARTWSR